MTREEQPETRDESSLIPAGTASSGGVGEEPPRPKEVSEQEAAELKQRSADIVSRLQEAAGSREMEIVDGIAAVGIQAQKQAGSQLQLLRVRVGDMLSDRGATGEITRHLEDLRLELNKINPNEVGRSGLMRILSLLPFGSKLMRIVQRIAIRYEEVSQQAAIIEKRLRDGQTMLRRDNIELRQLYEQVEEQQVSVKKNTYLGQLLQMQLTDLLTRTQDPRKREIVQSAAYDVAMRVQDLSTMAEVNAQFFVSIEMTRENNGRLGQAVDRTLTLATSTLMVGLAIQSALARQKRVMEATTRTREFLGEMIAANAAAIRQHTAEIGDVYKNPVVAIDKLTQAHNDLLEALNVADRLKTEGIETARENIAKLRQLTAELEEKSVGLGKPEQAPSLEA